MRDPHMSLARALVAAVAVILCACAGVACNIRFPSDTANASGTPSESRYQLTKDKNGRVLRLDTVTGEVTVAEPAPAPQTRQRAASAAATLAKVSEPTANLVDEVVAAAPSRPLPIPADPAPAAELRPPVASVAAPARAENNVCAREDFIRYVATVADVPVYIRPRPTESPLATLTNGVALMVIERSSDWVLLRFQDLRFGPRVGYAHCSQLRALDIDQVENAQKADTSPIRPAGAR
jgi:hypothetical protein